MNRIILIGNGFDLAHGLATRYTDFLNWYWKGVADKIYKDEKLHSLEDNIVKFTIGFDGRYRNSLGTFRDKVELNSYKDVRNYITLLTKKHDRLSLALSVVNQFFSHLLDQSYLNTWLDIENEYYEKLKEHLGKPKSTRSGAIERLNREFGEVKDLLEKYLTEECENKLPHITRNNDLLEYLFFNNGIERKTIALSKQVAYADSIADHKAKLLRLTLMAKKEEESGQKQAQTILTRRPYVKNPLFEMGEKELDQESERSIERTGVDPQNMMVLNFNYTPTFETLYALGAELEIVNIHGELNNPDNPIVFGYGDELDDDYKEIEKTNDNDLLDNIKSVAYGNTNNYRRLLEFLQLGAFQVFVLGHSCGNSDRTLLNEIFEHPNCASIKPFYHQREDGSDDFSNVYKNITRNFNNKRALRDIVVNKTYCKPHPQCKVPAELK